MPSSRSGSTAEAVGYGLITTSMSSISMAFFISTPRVWLFGAWPHRTIARRLFGWSMFSLSSSTPSIQRLTGMPVRFIRGLSLPSLPLMVSNLPLSQSRSSSQTRAQCAHEPGFRP